MSSHPVIRVRVGWPLATSLIITKVPTTVTLFWNACSATNGRVAIGRRDPERKFPVGPEDSNCFLGSTQRVGYSRTLGQRPVY